MGHRGFGCCCKREKIRKKKLKVEQNKFLPVKVHLALKARKRFVAAIFQEQGLGEPLGCFDEEGLSLVRPTHNQTGLLLNHTVQNGDELRAG